MCDPLTASAVATAGLSIGQAGLAYAGQNQASQTAGRYANLNYAQARETASIRANQQDQAQSEDAFDTAIAGAKAQGDIVASASDLGASPGSIAHSLNSAMFGLGRQATAEAINDNNQRLQLGQDLIGADNARRNTIASNPKGSPISLALGVGKGVLSGYNTYTKGLNKRVGG